MKHLLIITFYFPPIINPSVQRPYFYAKLLPRHGWDVTVITKKVDKKWEIDPAQDTSEMDVHHIKTWEWPRFWTLIHKLRLWSLIRHFVLYIRIGFILPAARKANQLMKEKKYDAVLISIPPDIFGLITLFLKNKKGTEIILDFRDPTYGYESKLWHNPLHQFLNFLMTKHLVNKGYKINSNSADNEEHLTKLFPKLEGRTSSVTNGFSVELRKDPPPLDRFIISHTGTLTRAVSTKGWLTKIHFALMHLGSYTNERIDPSGRSLIYITEAFKLLKDLRPDISEKLFFDMAGLVSKHDWQALEEVLGSENVRFQENVTLTETQGILINSHVLFLPQWDVDYCRVVLGKLYEYLGMHRPILACVTEGQMRKMLRPYKYAKCVSPVNPNEIAQAIIELHDQYATLSQEALVSDVSEYTRKNQIQRMAEFLNR